MSEREHEGPLPNVPTGFNGNGGAPKKPAVSDALDWAEVAAMLGDYNDALAWLDYVERVGGELPPTFADRRADWSTRASKG